MHVNTKQKKFKVAILISDSKDFRNKKLPGVNSPRRNSSLKRAPITELQNTWRKKLIRTERRSRQVYDYSWRLQHP